MECGPMVGEARTIANHSCDREPQQHIVHLVRTRVIHDGADDHVNNEQRQHEYAAAPGEQVQAERYAASSAAVSTCRCAVRDIGRVPDAHLRRSGPAQGDHQKQQDGCGAEGLGDMVVGEPQYRTGKELTREHCDEYCRRRSRDAPVEMAADEVNRNDGERAENRREVGAAQVNEHRRRVAAAQDEGRHGDEPGGEWVERLPRAGREIGEGVERGDVREL